MTRKKFLAWVASQDPKTTFNFFSNHDCAIARYLKAEYPGSSISVGGREASVDERWFRIPRTIHDLMYARSRIPVDTYQDLLDNAKRLS